MNLDYEWPFQINFNHYETWNLDETLSPQIDVDDWLAGCMYCCRQTLILLCIIARTYFHTSLVVSILRNRRCFVWMIESCQSTIDHRKSFWRNHAASRLWCFARFPAPAIPVSELHWKIVSLEILGNEWRELKCHLEYCNRKCEQKHGSREIIIIPHN